MVTVSVLLLLLSAFSPPVHSRLTAFYVIKDKMKWDDALKACGGNNTGLVTVYSDGDNAELANLMMTAGVRDGWIGLYRGNLSEKWSNGDPVTFRDLTGDCGTSWPCCAAAQAGGAWESLRCTETRNFMCYEQVNSSQPPNYHLILESKTWYEAQRYCRGRYTDLVRIRDQQQNEAVKTEGMKSNTPFWIGLLRDDWQWADGGNSTYRNWARGEPQKSPDCVELSGGNWNSVPCNSNDHYALCYNSSQATSNLTSGATPNITCTATPGATPNAPSGAPSGATPGATSGATSDATSGATPSTTSGATSGTTPSTTSGATSGATPSTTSGATSGATPSTTSGATSGATPSTTSGATSGATPSTTSGATSGATPSTTSNSPASIHVSDVALSWEEALDYCNEGNRAGILKLDSEADQKEVESELNRRRVSEPVWVGLRQSRLFGFWIWADMNAVFPYSNWDEGKQPEHQLSQHCGAVDPQKHFTWRDINCLSQYKALCHIKCSP